MLMRTELMTILHAITRAQKKGINEEIVLNPSDYVNGRYLYMDELMLSLRKCILHTKFFYNNNYSASLVKIHHRPSSFIKEEEIEELREQKSEAI